MASGRKPVWLEEQAHLLIKQYAKLTKTSMTETTSQLVLKHLAILEGESSQAEVEAPAEVAKEAAPAKASAAPAKKVESKKAEPTKAAPKNAEPTKATPEPAKKSPAKKRRPNAPAGKDRASSDNQDGVRYLGGIWLV